MDKILFELRKILADVKEKTGLNARLEPRGGEEREFTLDYCGYTVPVWVDGGEEAKERVSLLQYLLSNAGTGKLFPEKEEMLKNILLGEGGAWYAYRYMAKYRLPEGECYAMELRADKSLREALAHVSSCLEKPYDEALLIDEYRLAVVKYSEKEQIPMEYAQFLAQSLYEEMGIKASVGVGGEVNSFSEIASSYRQAVTANRMSALFHSKGEAHSYREYMLVRILEECSKERLKEFFEQFQVAEGQEIFENEELLSTAEAFLENNLNVSETSRAVYLHRNTLNYRLNKIERLTGLNIRNFPDAVSFRMMSVLYRLLHI